MTTKTVLIKKYKPITPGFRDKVGLRFNFLSKNKSSFLIKPLKRFKYKNSKGNLVNYNRQFGHKKLYRLVDFKREFTDIIGTVVGFEYDPNRNTNLALIQYENGTYSYIIDLEDLKIGDTIITGLKNNLNLNFGDCLSLKDIPLGTFISNIENKPNSGAVYLRSAGSYGLLFQKTDNTAKIQFKSGLIKEFSLNCKAVIGKIAGFENKFIKLGKAGVNR